MAAELQILITARDQATVAFKALAGTLASTRDVTLAQKVAFAEAEDRANRLAQRANVLGTELSRLKAQKAADEVARLGNEMEKAGSKIPGVVQALGAIGIAADLAAIAVSALAVKLAASFETATVELQNQADLSSTAVKGISSALLDAARDSEFSAQQLVTSLTPVAGRIESVTGSALTAAQALQVMRASANLAEAANVDLKDATASLVDVMLAYQIPLDQASKASDTLFNITRVTGIGLSEMSTAVTRLRDRLGNSAPDIAQMGALLAELSAQGISGSRGLLAVSSAIETLTGGSDAVNKTLHDLGVGVFDAQGNFIGLRSVIGELQPVFAKMTQAQQNAAAASLFGAGAAGTLLNVIKGGTSAFDDYAARIEKTGTAANAAAADNATLAVQIKTLRNDATALTTELGQELEPAVTKVVSVIRPLADAIADNHKAMIAIGIVIGGVLITGLIALSAAFYAVAGAAIVAFVAENAALLGIPLLVTAAIAALYLVVQNWNAIWAAMKAAPAAILDYIRNHWAKVIIDVILGPIGIIATNWKAIFDHMPDPVQTAMNKVASIVSTVTNFIISALNRVIDVINSIGSIGLPDWLGGASIGINIPHIPGVGSFELPTSQGRRGPLDESIGGAGSGARGRTVITSPTIPTSPITTGVVPALSSSGGGGGASAAIAQATSDLRALAAAFAVWHAQTGGSIEDFQAYLKVQQDNLDLTKRQTDASIALKVRQLEAADAGFQLRSALVAIAEHLAQTGESINQFIYDTATTALNGFKSAFDAIFNRPSRETAQLQLNLDQLQQRRLLLLRSHDTSDPQVKAIDAQIQALQNEISLRQTNIDILKQQAILADKTTQSDADQIQQANLLITAIGLASDQVNKFAGAAFFDALAHINVGNAVNEVAQKLRGIPGKASGGLASGLTLVGEQGPELVSLPGGSQVFSNNFLRSLSGVTAGTQSVTNVNIEQHFTVDSSMSDASKRDLATRVRTELEGALARARIGGSSPPMGAFA